MGSDASRSGFVGWGGLPGETPRERNEDAKIKLDASRAGHKDVSQRLARAEAGLEADRKWQNKLLYDIRELEERVEKVERERDSWKFAAQDCSKQWRNDIAELDHLRKELTNVWSNERHEAEMADLRKNLKDYEDYYEYAKLGAWRERDAARDRIEERKKGNG